MATWSNQSKNSATWSNQSRSSVTNLDYLLTEVGDLLLQEDSSAILLESSGAPATWSYQSKN